MNFDHFLKNENPEQVIKTVNHLKTLMQDRKKLMMRHYHQIVKSEDWKYTIEQARKEKWDNRLIKSKDRQKKYIIPEALMYNKEYWDQAIRDHKYMKLNHPDLII